MWRFWTVHALLVCKFKLTTLTDHPKIQYVCKVECKLQVLSLYNQYIYQTIIYKYTRMHTYFYSWKKWYVVCDNVIVAFDHVSYFLKFARLDVRCCRVVHLMFEIRSWRLEVGDWRFEIWMLRPYGCTLRCPIVFLRLTSFVCHDHVLII